MFRENPHIAMDFLCSHSAAPGQADSARLELVQRQQQQLDGSLLLLRNRALVLRASFRKSTRSPKLLMLASAQ